MNKNDIAAIQSSIGYTFGNARLIQAAFTHSSYVNEHDVAGNERIEFLGDCVLNFLVGEKLFKQDPTASEGTLSARRAALVSRAPLARIVDELGVIDYLQVGAGVDKTAFSVKARSDVFEAIVGAVYVDGGLDACRALLDRIFFPRVTPERDYKSELQVYAVGRGLAVKYDTAQCGQAYKTTVCVGNKKYTGTGKSKRMSQIAAAKAAVDDLMTE